MGGVDGPGEAAGLVPTCLISDNQYYVNLQTWETLHRPGSVHPLFPPSSGYAYPSQSTREPSSIKRTLWRERWQYSLEGGPPQAPPRGELPSTFQPFGGAQAHALLRSALCRHHTAGIRRGVASRCRAGIRSRTNRTAASQIVEISTNKTPVTGVYWLR